MNGYIMQDHSASDPRSVKAQLNGAGKARADVLRLFMLERRLTGRKVAEEFADVEFAKAIDQGWIGRRILLLSIILAGSLAAFSYTAHFLAGHAV